MDSFYSIEELNGIGFKHIGDNVLISRNCCIYSPNKIYIGNNVRIDDFCLLSGNITLGNHIHIAAYSAIYGGDDGVVISDFANISSRVTIYSICDDFSGKSLTNPMIPEKYKNVMSKPVKIEKHVIIGSTSVILPGVTLGEGSAFGAFSLVKDNINSWTINSGIPCKTTSARKKDLLVLEKLFIDEINNT